jgi:hypothetical protein
VIVTFVIDGGGWNFLLEWPDHWPVLKRLMREGQLHREGWVGSFPAVTASAHATIGTGALPRRHGISGHNVRIDGVVRKAYGTAGEADPADLLVPTLADVWAEESGGSAWVGEIGYQVWHLGMMGRGRRSSDAPPVGVYWDERANVWAPHHPDAYRLPAAPPDREALSRYLRERFGTEEGERLDREGGKLVRCTDPIVAFQGDLIEAAFASEPIGRSGRTDLLWINYKAPDYAGHTWNMQDVRTAEAMRSVDRQLGRLARLLDRSFPGEHVLIVTADHGQCPLPDDAGGVRIDPIQLNEDLRRAFDVTPFDLIEFVAPSEIFLSRRALRDAGLSTDDVAAFLRDYRYRDNIGWYIAEEAIQRDRMDVRPFAAVLSTDYVQALGGRPVAGFGSGAYPEGDLEVPTPA